MLCENIGAPPRKRLSNSLVKSTLATIAAPQTCLLSISPVPGAWFKCRDSCHRISSLTCNPKYILTEMQHLRSCISVTLVLTNEKDSEANELCRMYMMPYHTASEIEMNSWKYPMIDSCYAFLAHVAHIKHFELQTSQRNMRLLCFKVVSAASRWFCASCGMQLHKTTLQKLLQPTFQIPLL